VPVAKSCLIDLPTNTAGGKPVLTMPKRKLEEVDSGEDLNSAQSESDDSNCSSNGTNSSADIPTSAGRLLYCGLHR
jgi:hypothetical protein